MKKELKEKVETKKIKKVETKKVKKIKAKKDEPYFTGLKKELKKVRWPNKKEMSKYSIATLSFVIFFALFFMLADLIIAAVKVLVA